MRLSTYLLLIPGVLAFFVSSGCAVDNAFLAKLPLFEAKSDAIPGLQPPYERLKQVELKGEKGAKASEAEKEIIVAQLMTEYRTSPDHNMRRASVDAMAKIPHRKRDEYMKEILNDADPMVRLSALQAVGQSYNGSQDELTEIVMERMKRDPDKDVRLASIKLLGNLCDRSKKTKTRISEETRNKAFAALGDTLYDKVPMARALAMDSLHQMTGKDYGKDINKWIQHVQYVKGEKPEEPKERTFAERIPRPQLPMLK